MQMQEVLPQMGLKRAGTISVQMGKVTGVRTAALKGTLEVVSTYLTKNGKMLSGWFDEEGNPIEDSDTLCRRGLLCKRGWKTLTGEWLDYGEIDEGIGVPTWTVRLQEETTRIMTRCGFF